MIVQFFGIDVVKRNRIAKDFAEKTESVFCTDRELPMASLEAQFARWLRSIAGIFQRNELNNIVLSGYFPSKESRQQFKEGIDTSKVITVWIDTMDVSELDIPTIKNVSTDFSWELPEEYEYDIHITEDITYDKLSELINLEASKR